MVNKDFFAALDLLEKEKKIKKELLIESLEAGLASAFKREYGESRQVTVSLNEETATIKVVAYRTVVEEVDDYDKEISLEEAQEINPEYKVGDLVTEDVTPKDFSRIAAQTAKQVIIQRINDAQKEIIMNEMSEREGEILNAVVRRVEGNNVFMEMIGSQMEAILMPSVIVSRAAAGFVKRLFELEVPEIKAGLVVIKSIAREAGYRTKLSVYSDDPNVDAVGACIGQKGTRINAIVAELNGEKIDIVEWCADPVEYIARSLSPAKVQMVQINEEEKTAKAIVEDSKLSLAIGRNGQNVRLAAKLTGWKIDVKPYSSLTVFETEDGGVEVASQSVEEN